VPVVETGVWRASRSQRAATSRGMTNLHGESSTKRFDRAQEDMHSSALIAVAASGPRWTLQTALFHGGMRKNGAR